MDADYSHDSREIPELIKPTNAGGDWLSEADIAKEAALGWSIFRLVVRKQPT
jgi:hypothetical protein